MPSEAESEKLQANTEKRKQDWSLLVGGEVLPANPPTESGSEVPRHFTQSYVQNLLWQIETLRRLIEQQAETINKQAVAMDKLDERIEQQAREIEGLKEQLKEHTSALEAWISTEDFESLDKPKQAIKQQEEIEKLVRALEKSAKTRLLKFTAELRNLLASIQKEKAGP